MPRKTNTKSRKINGKRNRKVDRKRSKKINDGKFNKLSRKAYGKNDKKVFKKGGDGEDKVVCCLCGDEVNISRTLMPSGCKIIHGKKSHRICEDCWWNPETGFGIEKLKRKCPGCEKGLPLTDVKIEPPIFIDLTEDDDAA